MVLVEEIYVHLHDPPPNIYLPFYAYIVECLFPEAVLPQGLAAPRQRTGRGAGREDPVHAGLAHLVIAFWVYKEAHVRVEVAGGLADRAYFCDSVSNERGSRKRYK